MEYTPEEIDSMIAEGLDDIERGDTIDGEEAFRRAASPSATSIEYKIRIFFLFDMENRSERPLRVTAPNPFRTLETTARSFLAAGYILFLR